MATLENDEKKKRKGIKLSKPEKLLLAANLDAQRLKTDWNLRLWAIEKKKDGLTLRLDKAGKGKVNPDGLKPLLQAVLEPLALEEIKLKLCSAEKKCCQKQCKGCLFGDPKKRKLWVD